jgi:hypothetical protein
MPEPVLIAIPPKGGSLDDVLKKLVKVGWLRAEVVTEIRRICKDDKKRVKLEEGLIALWRESGGTTESTMRAADRFGHDLGDVEQALKRMRRYRAPDGSEQLGYTDKAGVDGILNELRIDSDPEVRTAALSMHLQLDITRPGKPARVVFNMLEFEFAAPGGTTPVHGMLMGTDHEVTPTWLRNHKRDLSLTCYDAFQNTLLDVMDTGAVRNWRELTAHLKKADTDVRILGSLGLDDYLGHCVLMSTERGKRAMALGGGRSWGGTNDPKMAILRESPVLIDPAYREIYELVLDAKANGITFETGPKDIEKVCAEQDRVGIYIVRSGSTIACTPGLCVAGEEIITSETIVAVNEQRMRAHPGVPRLIESLAPSPADHAPAWRAKLAARLGDRLV